MPNLGNNSWIGNQPNSTREAYDSQGGQSNPVNPAPQQDYSNLLPQGANTNNYWWADPNVLLTDQGVPNDRPYLQREPYLLADRFKEIEQEGVYGKGGVGQIMSKAAQAAALRRKKLSEGLKRGRLGRQLGPRSGAINNLIANKVWAPELGGLADKEANMMRENMLSKTSVGTGGLQSIMQYIQNRYNTTRGLEAQNQGNGLLDWIKPLTDLAAIIPGPQQVPAAAASALNNPRGPA